MRSKEAGAWAIAVIGLAFVIVTAIPLLTNKPERVGWATDFAAAKKEAATTHKPLFLYFTAKWCGPCQSLKTTTWADANVEKLLRGAVPVEIDVDAQPGLAGKYVQDGIPLFVIAKADGTPVREQAGYLDPAAFTAWYVGAATMP